MTGNLETWHKVVRTSIASQVDFALSDDASIS